MVRKRRKKKSKVRFSQMFRDRIDRIEPATRMAIGRWVLRAVILAVICPTIVFGLRTLANYVHNLPQFKGQQVTLTLANKPKWMDKALAEQIMQQSIGPVRNRLEQQRATGRSQEMARLLAQRLPNSAWVKHVSYVRRCYAGELVTACEFRRPVAMLQHQGAYRLVDETGVILPGKYTQADLVASGLLAIGGLNAKPPTDGSRWTRMDLQAALELVGMLDKQPYSSQICSIDVGNFGGRIDPLASWIVLITNSGSKIRWGRPPGQEMGLENNCDQKMALLAGLYSQFGRLDMKRTFVDIRRNPTEVDVPISERQLSDAGNR